MRIEDSVICIMYKTSWQKDRGLGKSTCSMLRKLQVHVFGNVLSRRTRSKHLDLGAIRNSGM